MIGVAGFGIIGNRLSEAECTAIVSKYPASETSRVNMRHGGSTVRPGERDTVGIIFHDAK
jgi:hypothetical protein